MKFLISIILYLAFSNHAFAHGMSEADKHLVNEGSNMQFFELGASHMLTGYDHLLFLFGVSFFLTKFKDIFLIITAFTIGHSISLIFATLWSITADYYLIDAVIALTVCYKGFENINGFEKHFNIKVPNINWMVFLFGLIHGFGLSTRLQQIPLNEQGLLLKIISFNLGVEIGQVVALSLMFVMLIAIRKTNMYVTFCKLANVSLIIIGLVFFSMQLHGYQHTHYLDDFPFNKHEHNHLHQVQAATTETKTTKKRDISAYEIKDGTWHTHDDGDAHFH